MDRYFNVAGPCYKGEHYMVEASERIKGLERLIAMKQYFVIHAARQSGKTTFLKDLTKRLNETGKYYTVYCSLECVQGFTVVEKGIPQIISCIAKSLESANIPNFENFAKEPDYLHISTVLNSELIRYCKTLDKPLIIFFDEADCLSESTLISFMRQLRDGYINRDITPFVHSVALVGMRNIRDYKAKIRPDCETLGSASPFNIVKEAYTLKNFTKNEIISLYEQHTVDTGQVFENDAVDFIFEQTQGQPWLVNAIATEIIEKIMDYDYSQSITADMAKTAIQNIIKRRDTHIDSLLERLKEDRVRKVIEPMLLGDFIYEMLSDDFQYVTDLGLIKNVNGKILPSNPIYAEVIARYLSYDAQQHFISLKPKADVPNYIKNGKIDVNCLMHEFQQFWRENSDIWIDKFQYKEAAPHLIMQAFLQRVLNGGGEINRELIAGTGRTDLCIIYDNVKYPIELKIWRGEKAYNKGVEQIVEYMDIFGSQEGWLIVFNRNPNVNWDEKIYYKQEIIDNKTVNVFGA